MSDRASQPNATMMALAPFHGPPDSDGWVEVGYRVVAEYRRQGFAEEAVAALLNFAAGHGAAGVRASVSPANVASIGLLEKLGFTGGISYRHPVLGEQLAFRHTVTSAS